MLTTAFALASIVVAVHGANDWATPCTSGACGYAWDGDGVKTAFSSMMLAGSNQVLSDITPAAGWQVMGCNPNWSSGAHDIRMVCAGTAEQMQNCQHLYDNGGAEETVVRLPQNCGTGPFARVQKTYVPQDQSMPANVSKIARRAAANSTQPAVRGLTLDYDFNKVPASRGKLLLGLASSNVGSKPLTRRDLMNLHKRGREGLIARRGFFDSIGDGVKGAFDDVKDAAGDVVDGAKSVAGEVADDVTSVAGKAFDKATSAVASVATAAATAVVKGVQEIKDATTINKTDQSADLPINIDGTFNLIDANVECEAGKLGGSASLKIDVAPKVNADVKFGYTFVGSVVPLKLDDVSVFSSMSGSASATFMIDAEAEGTFDTGEVPFFKAGLPGLSVPGIVSLGPEFSLNGQLNMALDVEVQMNVTTDFSFPSVELVFPQSSGKSSGNAKANKAANPVQLSSQQNVDVTGKITPHIIPRVDFGIDIGEGLAKASVFLEMDISGTLEMEVNLAGSSANAAAKKAANATAAATVSDGKNATAADKGAAGNGTATSTKKATATESSAKASASGKAAPKPSAKSASVRQPAKAKRVTSGGCVTLTGAIAINGGLDGKLEPLFDKEVKFPIFSTDAQLFQKCFGDQAAKPAARSLPAARSISGGSTVARRYRNHRRAAKAAAGKAAAGQTKNEITPESSKASTKELSCSVDSIPLSLLTALI